jgi:indolepyruvate ferredoxin oxidoreductase alpha subunit
MLLKHKPVKRDRPFEIVGETCTNCGMCLNLGCPAISRRKASEDEKPIIDQDQCTGCELCFQVCRFDSIRRD